jgi:inner membrane protein
MTQLNMDPDHILWDKAYLSLGITDMGGIQDKIIIHFNGAVYNAEPGLKSADLAEAGVSTMISPLTPNEPHAFSFDLNLNGSEQINIIPVGESNAVDCHAMLRKIF